jgi:hypothetical protein
MILHGPAYFDFGYTDVLFIREFRRSIIIAMDIDFSQLSMIQFKIQHMHKPKSEKRLTLNPPIKKPKIQNFVYRQEGAIYTKGKSYLISMQEGDQPSNKNE